MQWNTTWSAKEFCKGMCTTNNIRRSEMIGMPDGERQFKGPITLQLCPWGCTWADEHLKYGKILDLESLGNTDLFKKFFGPVAGSSWIGCCAADQRSTTTLLKVQSFAPWFSVYVLIMPHLSGSISLKVWPRLPWRYACNIPFPQLQRWNMVLGPLFCSTTSSFFLFFPRFAFLLFDYICFLHL